MNDDQWTEDAGRGSTAVPGTLAVGDRPGPRSEHWLAAHCWQHGPRGEYLCTRAAGHDGQHEACGAVVMAVWG